MRMCRNNTETCTLATARMASLNDIVSSDISYPPKFGIAIQICKRFLKNRVDTLVRLTEKSVGYKAAIRVYLRRQKHESALRLAHSYMSKNYLSQDECYTLLKDVTHQCIRRAIQNKSCTLSEDIAKFVQIIPDTREQAHFLKEANMYNAACDSLCQQGQYTSAYRICRAQHLYGKGIEIAHFAGPDHSQNRHLFILLQAEQQLINLQEPLHLLEGQAQLEQLLKVDDVRTEYRARAYLLLSVMALRSEKIANSEVQRLCLKAYRLYSKNKSGEIEAFCILNEIRGRMNENTVEHGKMLIDMIASVDQLCTLLKKNAAVFTLEINQIERFYGLERYGSNSYCVPQHHSYFLRLVMKKQVVDSDGMLELDRNNVIEQLICHYNTLINNWKTCVKNVEEAWLTRIEQFFSFHFELMDKPYYLQREHRKFSPEQVNEYLQMCEIALQMKQLNSSIFENNDITVALCRILSPFSQLRLPFQKENYLVMVSSDSVTGWTILKNKISKECEKIAANIKHPPNLDQWLEVWRLMHIFGEKKVNEMNYQINNQERIINERTKVFARFNPSREPPFSYFERGGAYQSIFSVWMWSCKCYKEGKALLATSISLEKFIQIIARRRSLRKTFSTENLLNILTVQCTSLFAMISATRYQKQLSNIMIIPESFELMIKTFDQINCTSQYQYRLLAACLKTSEEVLAHRVIEKSTKLLNAIVDIVIGIYNVQYCPLETVITHTELIHCLALIFTIFGNLLVHNFLTSTRSEFITNKIIDKLNIIAKAKPEFKEIIDHVYLKLDASNNTKDLFNNVLHFLLSTTHQKLILLETVRNLCGHKIQLKACIPQDVPQVPFKCNYKIRHNLPGHAQVATTGNSASYQEIIYSSQKVTTTEFTPMTDEQVQTFPQSIPERHDEASITYSHEMDSGDEVEDEEINKELAVAAQTEYKLQISIEDPKLERERSQYLYNNNCILCQIKIDEDGGHFKSEEHLTKRTQFNQFEAAQLSYNFTQQHLDDLIKECRTLECSTDYELEKQILNACELIISNSNQLADMMSYQDCGINLQQRKEKYEVLRNETSQVIYKLDQHKNNLQKGKKEMIPELPLNEEIQDEPIDENSEFDEILSTQKKTTRRKK